MPFRTRLLLAAGVVLTVVSAGYAVKSFRGDDDAPRANLPDDDGQGGPGRPTEEPILTIADYLRHHGMDGAQAAGLTSTLKRGGFHDDMQVIEHFEALRKQGIDVAHFAEVASLLEPGDLVGGSGTAAHPHGNQVCASGCAANAAATKPLTKTEFQRLIAAYAVEPMTDESEALAHLLYYGRQTRVFLKKEGHAPLDDERAAFLDRELKRDHVLVSFRMVDENGKVWAYHPPRRVPLDIRHEFYPDVYGIQPLLTSGTVKRTRLNHLWQRL